MNHDKADIDRIAAQAAKLAPRGGALLLRHGPREKIADASVASAVSAKLTEEGHRFAERFGTLLPSAQPLRLFHSPVPRCRDTASAIAKGHEKLGGAASILGARVFLAAAFVRDEKLLIKEIAARGLREFMHDWARGDVDESVVQPAELAARGLLQGIFQSWSEAQGTIDVHVTHDIVVLALSSLAWDITVDDFPWPGFLDGFVISFDYETLSASLWFHGEKRTVQLPPFEQQR